jgi:hypothetical protein
MGPVDKAGDGKDGIVFGFGFGLVVLLRDADRGEGCVSGIS